MTLKKIVKQLKAYVLLKPTTQKVWFSEQYERLKNTFLKLV